MNPTSNSTSRPRFRAFTLIELLTVIAIIGILAAIIVPVVSKVRESAKSAKCVSNLRQLGIAIQLYSAENKDMLPGGTNPYPWGGGGFPWNGAIKAYTQRDQNNGFGWGGGQVFHCASRTIEPASDDGTTYGANPLAMMDVVWGGGRLIRASSLQNPSRLILLMDAVQWPDGGVSPTLYQIPGYASGPLDTILQRGTDEDGANAQATYRFRHSGGNRANFLYADGGVRSHNWTELTRANFVP